MEVREDADVVRVRVADNGPGIEDADLPFIFEPFVQAGGDAPGDGMGIGLALVKALVELHEGQVIAENRTEGGAAFTVTLPLLRHGEIAATLPASEDAPRPRVKMPRVLVVDDNRDAADALVMLLEMSGVVARAVNDGPAAIDEAQAFRPGAIFMDVGMPGMNGIETTQRIRQMSLTPRPVIVALTGWGTASDREATDRAGFDHHLVKPVDLERVLDVLRNVEHAR